MLVRANELERKVIDLETGLRGYAITRDRGLPPADGGRQRQIPTTSSSCAGSCATTPRRTRRARAIESAVWTTRATGSARAEAPQLRQQLAAQMWAIVGRERMEAIRQRFAAFERAAEARAHTRGAGRYERAVLAIVLGSLLMLLGAASAVGSRRLRGRAAGASSELVAELAALRARSDELAAQLARQADLDTLTGVATRVSFLERLEQECAAARRHGGELSVVVLDVAGLGRINPERGIAAGDGSLARVAQVCTSQVRSSDAVGRVGGDEFALLLPRTPLRRAEVVAADLRRRIAAEGAAVLAVGAASAAHGADAPALLATASARAREAVTPLLAAA